MYYLQGSSPSIFSYLAYLFALSYVDFTFIVIVIPCSGGSSIDLPKKIRRKKGSVPDFPLPNITTNTFFVLMRIFFLQPADDPYGIKKDDLVSSLRKCLASTNQFAPVSLCTVLFTSRAL